MSTKASGAARRSMAALLLATLAGAAGAGCSVGLGLGVTIPLGGRPAAPVYTVEQGENESGRATWYSRRSHGRPTASGELHDANAMTAAHATHPFGTRLRVRRLDSGAAVTVVVNDRNVPRGRVVRLSYAAARALAITRDGEAPVALKVVE